MALRWLTRWLRRPSETSFAEVHYGLSHVSVHAVRQGRAGSEGRRHVWSAESGDPPPAGLGEAIRQALTVASQSRPPVQRPSRAARCGPELSSGIPNADVACVRVFRTTGGDLRSVATRLLPSGGRQLLPVGGHNRADIGDLVVDGVLETLQLCEPTFVELIARTHSNVADESNIPCPWPAFGYKCEWLAVRDQSARTIAEALDLRDTWTCGPVLGTALASTFRGRAVYVLPPLDGWTLVIHSSLGALYLEPEPLLSLSRKLGEVQYFGSHRGAGYCAWMRAINGCLARSFIVGDDDVKQDRGELTDAERSLGIDLSIPLSEALEEGLATPDEDTVLAVAAGWSVNPLRLDENPNTARRGIVGLHPARAVGSA
jgi:hypothetical protein